MGKASLLLRKCRTFIGLDLESKIYYSKAFIYTGVARAFILFVPFNKLRKRIGKVKEESPEDVDKNTLELARRVSDIVTLTSSHTPWESKCLVQALTAQRLLKEKGISTTLYLGVKKNSNNNMLAHAWLRCGKYYVTGGANRGGYAVVAKFAS